MEKVLTREVVATSNDYFIIEDLQKSGIIARRLDSFPVSSIDAEPEKRVPCTSEVKKLTTPTRMMQSLEGLTDALIVYESYSQGYSPREEELYFYLSTISKEGDITAEIKAIAWTAWKHLSKTVGDAAKKALPVPDAAPGPNGEVLYVWNKGEHHLELEIFPDGKAEIFYANRTSGELWEANYTLDSVLSQEVKEKLMTVI